MRFTAELPKEKSITLPLPLVFIDSVRFLSHSLEILVKNLGENDFYHLSQEFNANVLDSITKKEFFLMITEKFLKNLRQVFLAKIKFIVYWLIVQLVIKIISLFLTFEIFLKWKLWKIIMICTYRLVFYNWLVPLKLLEKNS